MWAVLGGLFRSCPPTSRKLPLCANHQTQRVLGQLLRSLLQNRRNFSEVAPEVRPAVHTAPLRRKKIHAHSFVLGPELRIQYTYTYIMRAGALYPWSHKPCLLNGRLENCKIGGCKEIRQPFANPSPTLCQPFANLSPTLANLFCQPLSNPLFP